MFEYAIESFLLDVYYPIGSIKSANEAEGAQKQSIFGRIKKLVYRFIEFLKTHVIDRVKRWISRIRAHIRNRKKNTNENAITVSAEYGRLVDTTFRMAKTAAEGLQTIRDQLPALFDAGVDDQNGNKTEKLVNDLKEYASKSYNDYEYEVFKNTYANIKSTRQKNPKEGSRTFPMSNIERLLGDFDTLADSARRLTTYLTNNIRNLKEFEDAPGEANLNIGFSNVIKGLVVAENLVANYSKIIGTSQQVLTDILVSFGSDFSNVSAEFKKTVDSGNKLRTRIILTNYVISDPSFKTFDASLAYAKRNIQDFMDTHDGEKFEDDTSKWTKDYLNKQLNNLVDNFSQERVNFVRKLAKHIYHK